MCVARHAQSNQSKFAISLQYLQKNVGDEVDFLSAYKHDSFLQADNIFLGVHSQACSKYPKQQVCNISVDFLPADKHHILGFVARHAQVTQNKFFFYVGYLSRKFTILRTTGEGRGYFFDSSLPIPPSSPAFRDLKRRLLQRVHLCI